MFSDTVDSAVWYARTPEAPIERRSLMAASLPQPG
jgi:hypothetical protein